MNLESAKNHALHLLSSKMYTCHEIYQRLVTKGCDEDIAEQTIKVLCNAGILDDEQYAEFYIHDAASISLKGIFRIKQDLLKKGIAASIIDRAVQNSDIDTAEQLCEYVKLRFADKVFSDRRELEKAKAHLLRKGYSYSEINKCFNLLDIKVNGGDWD